METTTWEGVRGLMFSSSSANIISIGGSGSAPCLINSSDSLGCSNHVDPLHTKKMVKRY